MNREDFSRFVGSAVEGSIRYAEEFVGQPLSRQICFRWMGSKDEPINQDFVVQTIVERVYVDETHIYPCVDLGVYDILDDGRLLLEAYVAGYSPKTFQKNWTGTDGPFIYLVGKPICDKLNPAAFSKRTPKSGL